MRAAILNRDASKVGEDTPSTAGGRLGPALRLLLRGGTLFVALAGLVLALRATGLDTALDEHWIDRNVDGQGLTGLLIFLGAAGVFTAAGLPRQIVSFLGGYAFGLWAGVAAAVLATVLGAAAAFGYARFIGQRVVKQRFPDRVQRIDAFLARHPFRMTLLIRFLPVGSNLVTNLAAGVSSVKMAPFLVGSAVGYVPQTLVFALLGAGTDIADGHRIAIAGALFLLSGAIGSAIYLRQRRDRKDVPAIDPDL